MLVIAYISTIIDILFRHGYSLFFTKIHPKFATFATNLQQIKKAQLEFNPVELFYYIGL